MPSTGREAIAFYISGQLLTEDYYAVNKLAKGYLGTNNVDSNSRLCMSSAVAAYDATFGADGPPPAYADLEATDCILLLGSNASACHPILWGRIRAAQERGATLIVVDPRRTDSAAAADIHFQIKPGTDLALLNALIAIAGKPVDADGIDEVLAAAAEWTPERASDTCGVPAQDIVAAARAFGDAGRRDGAVVDGRQPVRRGRRHQPRAAEPVRRDGPDRPPGAGPLSLTGQPNAMGGREVGGLAHLLPGYRKVVLEEHRREVESALGAAGRLDRARSPGSPPPTSSTRSRTGA